MVLLHQPNPIRKRFCAIILIFCIVGFISFSSGFLHTHVGSNGTIIIHSHPFSKTNDNETNHTHSAVEFLYYTLISIFIAFTVWFVLLRLIPLLKKNSFQRHIDVLPDFFVLNLNGNRAPPVI